MAYKEKPGLGVRIREVRKRRGIRQRDAAREIGVSRKTYCRVECGYFSPRDDTQAKFRHWLEEYGGTTAGAGEEDRDETGAAVGAEEREAEVPGAESGSSERVPAAGVPAAGVPVRLRLAILQKIGQG